MTSPWPGDTPPSPSRDLLGETYLTAAELAHRVAELGGAISADYAGRDVLLVSVLKGAVFFVADLARAIAVPVEMDFMAISSYAHTAGTHTPGTHRPGVEADTHAAGPESHKAIRFIKDLDRPLEKRDVIVVEDIIDTGLTLNYILRSLGARGPRSLEVCTLLDRPYRRIADIDVRYVGFTVPDDFFVGYGFDYRQAFRNLPDLTYLHI